MNIKDKPLYIKAKELRQLITEAVNGSIFENKNLRDKLLNYCLEIPFDIALGQSYRSSETTRKHLKAAEKKIILLLIAADLSASEYFQIDAEKLDSITDELFDLIPAAIEKAVEDEQKEMEEMMKEFMVDGE